MTWPAIEEHRDYIVAQLAAGVTMATIHQRLRDERGLAASVASLRRYVAANLPEEARRSQVTVLRLVPAEPGQEAQIDYGQLGRWTDPATGRRHVVNAFAMVLCCSRHLFVRPVLVMDQRAWTECHVAAFGFFGGVPARLVPDNLKTGVDRPDLYDPKINRSYAELAAHYGCLVDPARSRKPRDKAAVERPMPYIRDSFWRGREFTSLEQMQAGAGPLVRGGGRAAGMPAAGRRRPGRRLRRGRRRTRWRRCRRIRSCSRSGRGARSARTSTSRSAGPCTRCRGSSSARPSMPGPPPRRCSCSPAASWSRPMSARPRASRPTWVTTRRRRSRSTCAPRPGAASRPPGSARPAPTLIAGLLEDNALYRLRAAQGVLGLADKHQPGRLEAACARAIAAGDPSYRTVKGILAAGTEATTAAAPAGDGGAAAFLHGPDALFAAEPLAARRQRRAAPGRRGRQGVMTALTTRAPAAPVHGHRDRGRRAGAGHCGR